MHNIEKLREIIAQFLKKEPSDITEATIIDSRAIRMSIILRRMYAVLAKEGVNVRNPKDIKTFGDLLNISDIDRQNVKNNNSHISDSGLTDDMKFSRKGFLLGIDIEAVENMPNADDFRESSFYTQNYSSSEISYCILQKNPLISFTGRFAAKEAIVKADNSYLNSPFHEIEILNNEDGLPYFKDFVLSISHTEKYAVAAALKSVAQINEDMSKPSFHSEEALNRFIEKQLSYQFKQKKTSYLLSLFAFFISFISFGIVLWNSL